MTDNNAITNLADARTLKRLGWPLNTPIIHQEFSETCGRHWAALMDTQAKFENAMFRYLLDDTQSPAKWWSARRRFIALERQCDHCVVFMMVELGGNTPPEAPPVFKSEQDAREYALIKYFFDTRACRYLAFWESAIDAAEAGNTLTFTTGDIPPWTDED